MARPTKYKPEYAAQAEKLCLLGATDQEIADFFEVTVRTIHSWKLTHAEFLHSLKAGKEAADDRVERSLFQRAIGYEQDEVKIFLRANDEKPVYAEYRAKIAPDTTAAIFWLKNRRKMAWRDASSLDVNMNDPRQLSNEQLAHIAAGGSLDTFGEAKGV